MQYTEDKINLKIKIYVGKYKQSGIYQLGGRQWNEVYNCQMNRNVHS